MRFLFIIIAAVAVVGSSYLTWMEDKASPVVGGTVALAEPEQNVGDWPIEQRLVAQFVLVNSSSSEARIIGFDRTCGHNCCLMPSRDEHSVIPANGTLVFEAETMLHRTGPFKCSLVLFIDSGGMQEVKLTVRGHGVSAGMVSTKVP